MLSEKPPFASPPEISEHSLSGSSTSTPPIALMKSSKPSKSTITTWSMSIPRKPSTVSISSPAPPKAYAPLIFWALCPGISAKLSRGIDSFRNAPPPARTSISVSARNPAQPVPGGSPLAPCSRHFSLVSEPSRVPGSRASVPITRIVWGSNARNGFPPSSCLAPSSSFDFWIWAEIANTTMLSSSHAPTAITTHRHQGLRPGTAGAFGGRSPGLRSRSRSEATSGARSRLRSPGRDL
jgi:hypothetical protein